MELRKKQDQRGHFRGFWTPSEAAACKAERIGVIGYRFGSDSRLARQSHVVIPEVTVVPFPPIFVTLTPKYIRLAVIIQRSTGTAVSSRNEAGKNNNEAQDS